jgi:hypothetical protein
LAVGHAGWHLRKEWMIEQAEMIAEKMAEKTQVQSSEAEKTQVQSAE